MKEQITNPGRKSPLVGLAKMDIPKNNPASPQQKYAVLA
jgi:hypothetical protein